MRLLATLLAIGAVAAGPALAQGSASIGRSSGVVHGQSWNSGQQDLSGFNTGSGGRPATRTQALRQRSAATQSQARPAQQPARRTTQARPRTAPAPAMGIN